MLAISRRVVLALIAVLIWSPIATAQTAPPIDVQTLLASDVIEAPGGSFTDDERATLVAAAAELAKVDENGESFPSKFIAVPAPAEGIDLDQVAADLRRAGVVELGDGNALDAVFLIAPRALGTGANAFPDEIRSAFQAEIETLRRDRAEGTVAIARRLQHLDAINARVAGADENETSDGWSPLRWVLLGAVVVVGAIGFVLAHRASKRRDQIVQADDPPTTSD